MAPVAVTALGEAPTKPAAMSNADPIFAAIEHHKDARAAYLAAMDVPGEDREIRAAEDSCQQAEHDAFYELSATAPATVVAMAALFEHLASPRWEGDSDYTVMQSVAEDWGSNPEAANEWVTMMVEASFPAAFNWQGIGPPRWQLQ